MPQSECAVSIEHWLDKKTCVSIGTELKGTDNDEVLKQLLDIAEKLVHMAKHRRKGGK